MKITKVEPLVCDGGWRPWVFVKIETDEGITGYGECKCSLDYPLGTIGYVKDLGRSLVGQDPRAVEKLHWQMRQRTQRRTAIGGIETALWDIKAKALGVPVYELFGGPIRDKVRLYWSHCGSHRARRSELLKIPPLKTMDDIADLGREVVERGFTALKTNLLIPGGEPYYVLSAESDRYLNIDNDIVEAVERLISTFREAVGNKVDICLDINFLFNIEGFIRIAKTIEPYNLMWLELDTHEDALLQIKQSTKTPICSGESLYTSWEYKSFFDLHALDVAMVDIPLNGFIESRRIAALADIYGIMIAPHNCFSHLATLIGAHLCAAVPNVKIMEIDVEAAPWRDDLVTHPPKIKDGYLIVPDRPGLGTDLNEKEIAKHPWPKQASS